MFYQCKHCNQPVHDYTTTGINEWMSVAVVLMENGCRLIGEFDTEHSGCNVNGWDIDYGGGNCWLHKECWELAGRPEFENFIEPSKSLSEDDYIERDSLWIVSPLVEDEDERQKILDEGKAAYDQRMFEFKAQDLDMLYDENPEDRSKEEKKYPHRQLFRVTVWEHDGTVGITDRLNKDYTEFDGTKRQAENECKRLYEAYLASEEFKALRAFTTERERQYEEERVEKLKAEGRYEVQRSLVEGDTIKKKGERDWVGQRTFHYVNDKWHHDDPMEFDGPNKALGRKTFIADDKPTENGYASLEWEARLKEIEAAEDESYKLAHAYADTKNREWAEAGYPLEEYGAS